MLLNNYQTARLEAGLDEAGRGCYAGPVFAAAVILPPNFYHPLLNDSIPIIKTPKKAIAIIILSTITAI
jgi:ribonuclease HII